MAEVDSDTLGNNHQMTSLDAGCMAYSNEHLALLGVGVGNRQPLKCSDVGDT